MPSNYPICGSWAAGPRNMCRIMYFQCGIGAHQQRLKLSDGRLFQVDGPDSEKSLVSWLLMIVYYYFIWSIFKSRSFFSGFPYLIGECNWHFSLTHWRMWWHLKWTFKILALMRHKSFWCHVRCNEDDQRPTSTTKADLAGDLIAGL